MLSYLSELFVMPITFTHPAKKRLGQHFLTDSYVIDHIVQAIDPQPGQQLVEIGPGQGALSLPLLQRNGHLTAIEFDRDLIAPLAAKTAALGHLHLIQNDVLNVDLSQLAGEKPLRLVGNLPYNLSTPILFHALNHAAVISDMTFMLQKEVVQRMAAHPGSKIYGRLSVMLQAYCEVRPLFDVPPQAFSPPPKVDSAVVRLVPRDPSRLGIKDPLRFAQIVKAAFAQRRKTLRNALHGMCSTEQMAFAEVPEHARAEQLAVADFVRLAASPQIAMK